MFLCSKMQMRIVDFDLTSSPLALGCHQSILSSAWLKYGGEIILWDAIVNTVSSSGPYSKVCACT